MIYKKQKPKIVYFQGGLGNQMFQYVFCLYIEHLKYKVQPNIDYYLLKINPTKHAQTPHFAKIFEIDDFKPQAHSNSIFIANNSL